MTSQLSAPLLNLFAPRPPLRYLKPTDLDPEVRKTPRVTGLAEYVDLLKSGEHDAGYTGSESWAEARERKKKEKIQREEHHLREGLENYNPNEDKQVRGDPYKTLFISRLSYEATETDLEAEFGRYGMVERVRIVRNKEGKSQGYAFIVFEREKDMKVAYKETDGLSIKNRRILVDVERGRTVKSWKPMRLGGGLGGRGYTKNARRGGGFNRDHMSFGSVQGRLGPQGHPAYPATRPSSFGQGVLNAPSGPSGRGPSSREGIGYGGSVPVRAPEREPSRSRGFGSRQDAKVDFESSGSRARHESRTRDRSRDHSSREYRSSRDSYSQSSRRDERDRPSRGERSPRRERERERPRERESYHAPPPPSGMALDPRAARGTINYASVAAPPAAPWLTQPSEDRKREGNGDDRSGDGKRRKY